MALFYLSNLKSDAFFAQDHVDCCILLEAAPVAAADSGGC